MKTLLFPILLAIFSCTGPQHLHQTGTYTISSVDGDIVTFKGVSGKYQMPVDTLAVGDTIRMNVIHFKN